MKQTRIKRQPNGLLEPHTVMLHERPHVVNARDLDEAKKEADKACKKNCEPTDTPEEPTELIEEEGDAS